MSRRKASQHLIAYAAEMRRRLNDFIACLTEDQLSRLHEYETRQGVFRATVEETLHHMVNHATCHRGQVAFLLKLHGVDFADTDIIIWLNQRSLNPLITALYRGVASCRYCQAPTATERVLDWKAFVSRSCGTFLRV